MGNKNSSQKPENEFNNFYNIIDYIATYYILTMDFKSLSKLSEKEYCNKLVILTSDIIKRYFNDMEISYLAQRIKNGEEINEMSKDKIIFFNKDDIENLDVSNDLQKNIKKKRVCIGIAKFYVKIAHIFAAIVTTINPVYKYKDLNGETKFAGLLEKNTIPKNVEKKVYKLNICDDRIRVLNNGVIENELDKSTKTIKPKICEINLNKNGEPKTLADEPGINELMQLYLDDNYDYSNGTFKDMTETTKKQFMNDLKTFYTAFTGNSVMPPEITKFSDIKLNNYKNKSQCNGNNPVFKNSYTVNKNDTLFIDYAKNIQKMIDNASANQVKLLDVINELFTGINDPFTHKKKIRVNPKLTEKSLQKAIENTRKYIVDLYVNCELDFVNGIKLYEAIVEKKIIDTTTKQINYLEREKNALINESKELQKSVKENPNPNLDLNPNININVNPNPNINPNININVNPNKYENNIYK
jgi:hypothetical protein